MMTMLMTLHFVLFLLLKNKQGVDEMRVKDYGGTTVGGGLKRGRRKQP